MWIPLAMAEVAGAYTPVPGGVGPLTIAMLMVNTIEACERACIYVEGWPDRRTGLRENFRLPRIRPPGMSRYPGRCSGARGSCARR